ncbi:hypothetical protein [Butyrivibrio proteoclasticus]|nr:hypothetical protein [Butyrivibrio proteoclasticus]
MILGRRALDEKGIESPKADTRLHKENPRRQMLDMEEKKDKKEK